jgi:hypothetical protein
MRAPGNLHTLREPTATILIIFGVALVALGALFTDTSHAIFDAQGFADRAADALGDKGVSAYVATRITDEVIQVNRDLTPYRPILLATAQGIVSSDAFRALVRTAARRAHHTIFSRGGRNVLLSLPDVGVLLKSAMSRINPQLAEKIPRRSGAIIAGLGRNAPVRFALQTWQITRRIAGYSLVALIAGCLFLATALLAARRRHRALIRIGLGLIIAAAALMIVLPLGRAIVSLIPRDPISRGAAAGIWSAYTHGLRTWALLLGGVGLVFASAGKSLLEKIDLAEQTRRGWRWLENPPGGAAGRIVRGSVLVAIGVVAVLSPSDFLTLLTTVIGAGLAFVGLRELFGFLHRWIPEEQAAPEGPSLARRGPAFGAGPVIGLALLAGAFIVFISMRSTRPDAVETDACNGATALCSRPVDQVVFPGTHNSMSSAEISDWMFPEQEKGIAAQLQDGIRAFLIDAHYGRPVGGRVKTDMEGEYGSAAKFEQEIGPEAYQAAMRIRDRLVGLKEGPRGVYLAHGFCELGCTPLVKAFREMHDFLTENPNEVILLVVEDYVTPQDLAGVIEESGLSDLVYQGPVEPPWPTLGQMVDDGQRVVVMIESGRPGVPWIHPAFEILQETPFTVHRPEEFSCAPNRGGTSGSLFLLNHWIETAPTPLPKNAATVNAYDFLLNRVESCQRNRGHRVNIIAVDFYRTGDLFRVCRTLNGIETNPDSTVAS